MQRVLFKRVMTAEYNFVHLQDLALGNSQNSAPATKDVFQLKKSKEYKAVQISRYTRAVTHWREL